MYNFYTVLPYIEVGTGVVYYIIIDIINIINS